MAHAQKPDFVFRRNGRVHLNRRGASVQSTTGSRGERISGSNAAYTPFANFPFTSPPVRHRVPSHSSWVVPMVLGFSRLKNEVFQSASCIRRYHKPIRWESMGFPTQAPCVFVCKIRSATALFLITDTGVASNPKEHTFTLHESLFLHKCYHL
jgi:hypothetical protein